MWIFQSVAVYRLLNSIAKISISDQLKAVYLLIYIAQPILVLAVPLLGFMFSLISPKNISLRSLSCHPDDFSELCL